MLQIKNTLGGGKPEGLYVWKKYEYTNGIYLTNPKITSAYISSTTKELTGSNFNLSDVFEALGISAGTYSYTTNEYKALAKFFDGMNDGTFGLVNGWYGHEDYLCYVFDITNTNTGLRNIESIQVNSNSVTISHNNADITSGTSNKYFTYTGEKTVIEQGKCGFIDYIISDKETAFPDGGEKGGYWYEKVVEFNVSALGITNFEIGSFTLTSASSFNTVNHSLGILPKAAILFGNGRPKKMAEIFTKSGSGGVLLIDDNGDVQSSTYDAKATTTTVKFHAISNSYAFKAGLEYRYAIFA